MAGPTRETDGSIKLPPQCIEADFTGAAHDALLSLIRSMDPKDLVDGIVAAIERHGATNNQRELIHAAWREMKCSQWESSQKAGS